MKLSRLIKELQAIENRFGDMHVATVENPGAYVDKLIDYRLVGDVRHGNRKTELWEVTFEEDDSSNDVFLVM